MAADKKKRGMWLGHPLLAPEHEHELHLAAALHEFQGGMPREEAERRALEDYRREHHARAAAHHYAGMKAGHATGNMDDAKKHHALYSLHVKALGEDPMGPVPQVVRKFHGNAGKDEKQRHVYSFRGHDADEYLVQPVTKSELELCDLKKAGSPEQVVAALRQASANIAGWCDLSKYFDELAKGDLVQGPWKQPAASVTAPPADPAQPPGQATPLDWRARARREAPDWVPVGKTCDNDDCPGGNERYAADAQPGYSLCIDCLNESRRRGGQAPYDPNEYKKRGYASPEEMLRARVGDVFEQGARLYAEDQASRKPRNPDLQKALRMYDATSPNDPMLQQDKEIRDEMARNPGMKANDALLAISKRKMAGQGLKKAVADLKTTLDVVERAKALLEQLQKK